MGKSKFLDLELRQFEGYIPKMDILTAAVSQVPVAWHLDHMLKTILHISKGLSQSDPGSYKRSFSALRLFCHSFNFIPRGKAQSPKYVLPPEVIVIENIIEQLAQAKIKLQKLDDLDKNANINHPFFKQMNLAQSKRFIQVHTRHHLKIVRDILKIR